MVERCSKVIPTNVDRHPLDIIRSGKVPTEEESKAALQRGLALVPKGVIVPDKVDETNITHFGLTGGRAKWNEGIE